MNRYWSDIAADRAFVDAYNYSCKRNKQIDLTVPRNNVVMVFLKQFCFDTRSRHFSSTLKLASNDPFPGLIDSINVHHTNDSSQSLQYVYFFPL